MSVAPNRDPASPRLRRRAVVAAVVALLVGVGVIDHAVGRSSPSAPPVAVASVAAPIGSESSSWYCAGSSGAGGPAAGTVVVTNVGPVAVSGSITVTDNAGATVRHPLEVPARGQFAVRPSDLEQGDWLASTVEIEGGGVVVSQVVQGPTGWAESACASTALSNWYFASGATSAGATLVLTLFNPTSTAAVVDTTFDTSTNTDQPQPFEGIVVDAGQVVALNVGTYVQGQRSVSTVVSARSGRIVAEELQLLSATAPQGLALRLGAPSPRSRWFLAGNTDTDKQAGLTQFDVFNPTDAPERVTVAARLQQTAGASAAGTGLGSLVPFVRTVPAGGTWHLQAQSSPRIAAGTSFSVSLSSSGGAGVVVERIVSASPSAPSPQWGVTPATGSASIASTKGGSSPDGALRWVIPAPGSAGSTMPAGAGAARLTVQNVSRASVSVVVSALVGGTRQSLGPNGRLRIPAGGFASLGTAVLTTVAADPLLVEAVGPVAVVEDLSPAGANGVVAFGGVPLAAS